MPHSSLLLSTEDALIWHIFCACRFFLHRRKVRDGYYRVAWAYLSPQSSLGQPHLGQVSLQLYYYAPPPRFQGRDAPEVFTTWQRLCDARLGARARRKRARRLLYPAAITVTLAAVPRPQEATVVAAPQV